MAKNIISTQSKTVLYLFCDGRSYTTVTTKEMYIFFSRYIYLFILSPSANFALITFSKIPSSISIRVFPTRLYVPNGRVYRVKERDYFVTCISHCHIKSSSVILENQKGKLIVIHNISNMLSSANDLFQGF